MSKYSTLIFILMILMARWAQAEEVIPATSEDIESFSASIAASRGLENKSDQNKIKPSNFGVYVSQEAKAKKEFPLEQRRDFGQIISRERHEQVRQDQLEKGSGNASSAREKVAEKSHGSGQNDSGNPGHSQPKKDK